MSEKLIATYVSKISDDDPKRTLFIQSVIPSLKPRAVCNSPNPRFVCAFCNENNNEKKETNVQTASVTETSLKTFATLQTYTRHLSTKHLDLLPCDGNIFESAPIVIKCTLCNTEFKRKDHYNKHLTSITHLVNQKQADWIKTEAAKTTMPLLSASSAEEPPTAKSTLPSSSSSSAASSSSASTDSSKSSSSTLTLSSISSASSVSIAQTQTAISDKSFIQPEMTDSEESPTEKCSDSNKLELSNQSQDEIEEKSNKENELEPKELEPKKRRAEDDDNDLENQAKKKSKREMARKRSADDEESDKENQLNKKQKTNDSTNDKDDDDLLEWLDQENISFTKIRPESILKGRVNPDQAKRRKKIMQGLKKARFPLERRESI